MAYRWIMLRRLITDTSGNFAYVTALLALPLMAVAGMAVDYSRALSEKTRMQDAADGAVLAAAASGKTDHAQLSAIATQYFNGNISQHGIGARVIDISIDAAKRITLTVGATVPVSFARVMHPEGIPIRVVAQAEPGQDSKIEIALVLDNTYSMYGKKLTDLKAASKSMISIFQKADPQKMRIKVGLVPFSRYVNVGVANRNQTWLDVPADYSTSSDYCTTSRPVVSQSGCTTTTKTGYNDGVSYTYEQKQCTSTKYGDPVTTCGTRTSTYKWSGCVDSRKSPYDVTDGYSPKYSGLMNITCGSAIASLTTDYASLSHAIDAMTANNETYIAPGILWGWNILTAAAPFEEALTQDPNVKKIMVVMTDGANTKSPSYPQHNASDVKKADQLMKTVCQNAKSAEVTLYTVAVGVTENTALSALASCASDSTKALSIENTADLEKTFDRIATQILTTRLTM